MSTHRYKTPEGYLVCVDAILARTGKQQYRHNELFVDSEDDRIIDVDRPYEEVFSEKTIASFENKPFVNEHPDEDVNVTNHRDYAVGFVRDVHEGNLDGEPVLLGNIIVTDEEAIAEIESGAKVELSCGYDCDILDEENPRQRNIRGNHVALCKAGRAGIARIVDSKVEDSAEDDFYDDLFSSNIKYEFIKGGYGIKFKTPRDYQKAKEIAKRNYYTKGHWYDKDLEFFEYGGITISNEDSITDADEISLAKQLLERNNIKVVKTTGVDENFYLFLENKTEAKKAISILSQKYSDVKEYRDSGTGLTKIRVGKGLDNIKFSLKQIENEIQKLGYKVIRWYTHSGDNVAVINSKEINLDGYEYFSQQIKKLKKFGYAKDIYADDNEIIFYNAKFNLKDSIKDTHFTVSSNNNSEEFKSEEELLKKYKIEGYETIRGIKAPKLKGLMGPFFNGEGKILYETKERYMSYDSEVEDGRLIEPEQKYVKEFERMIQRLGFKIDKTGKTISGRLHYQVITNQKGYDETDLKRFLKELEKISKTMRNWEIPMTYNIGLQSDTYISAGIDLDKQWINDSVEDSINDEAIYMYIADSDDTDDKEIIDRAKSNGLKLEKFGGLTKVIGNLTQLAKVLKMSKEDVVAYSKQPRSIIKKVKDSDILKPEVMIGLIDKVKSIKTIKTTKDSCNDTMELSAKTSEELDNLMKQYQRKHPTWKFGEIRKDKGLYRCSVVKDSKVKDGKKYTITFALNGSSKETKDFNTLEEFDRYLSKNQIGWDYVWIYSIVSNTGYEYKEIKAKKWTEVRQKVYKKVLMLDSNK